MAQPTPTTPGAPEPTIATPRTNAPFTSTSERPIAAVQRALAVLDCLAAEPADLGTNEIARRVGSNASSVSRLLATLARQEYVRRIPSTGRYRLGLRLVELGQSALARVDLREVARPHLLALTAASGETATLSVPGEATPMTVDFVQSPSSVRSVAQVGRPSVAHATATGKVFLAFAGPLAGTAMTPYTSRTITDPAELAAQIDLIRRRGWAHAVREREEDLNALAAPVRAGATLVGVIGLQGPADRFRPKVMRGAVEVLLDHCAELASEYR